MNCPRGDLVRFIHFQQEIIANLSSQNARLTSQIETLTARVKHLEEQARDNKRPQAPFSKGEGKKEPKAPGRKKGQGSFKRREAPEVRDPDQVVTIEVPLKDDQKTCACCQVPMEISAEEASIIDVPEVPAREITRFHVQTGKCPQCAKRVRGQHAALPASQCGANAHQVGPRAMSLALSLHYEQGLPMRKVPAVLEQWTGIRLTQGGINQKAIELCQDNGMLHQHYQRLHQEVEKSPVVNTDDTGWRINGKQCWLMGFFTQCVSFFQIRWHHRHEEVLEVIGENFSGLLGTDRGTSYEAKALDEMQMQKCLSHVLKNISTVEKSKEGPAKVFGRRLQKILREGIQLWHEHREGKIDDDAYRQKGLKLEKAMEEQLKDRALTDPDNQRLLDGLGRQMDRGRLTLFLKHPEIEPTNNVAERGLRPAVIARKVSHCSKNEKGAQAYAVMKTILGTLKKRTKHVTEALACLLRGESFEAACQR